jgi:hypothetical protein
MKLNPAIFQAFCICFEKIEEAFTSPGNNSKRQCIEMPRCQFHHHFMSSFRADILAPLKCKHKILAQKKLRTKLLYKKTARKCW